MELEDTAVAMRHCDSYQGLSCIISHCKGSWDPSADLSHCQLTFILHCLKYAVTLEQTVSSEFEFLLNLDES